MSVDHFINGGALGLVTIFIKNFSLHFHSIPTPLRLHPLSNPTPQLYKTKSRVWVECVTPLRLYTESTPILSVLLFFL